MDLTGTLTRALGGRWSARPLSASSFCETWVASQGPDRLFVKTGAPELLAAEADGLFALAATRTIRVPHVAAQDTGLLALEWLEFTNPDASFGRRLGEALAQLHDAPCDERYGWHRDNFIGATPQSNTRRHAKWIDFLAAERLHVMAQRLRADAALVHAVDDVIAALPRFFDDGYPPRPSLIHGDLWSGNWGMLADGSPVIFDPAVSVSDAEADVAMMDLFGAAPPGFHDAYGMHAGYARRKRVYQLYHLLNHAVLFGGGYAQQALRVARELLSAR